MRCPHAPATATDDDACVGPSLGGSSSCSSSSSSSSAMQRPARKAAEDEVTVTLESCHGTHVENPSLAHKHDECSSAQQYSAQEVEASHNYKYDYVERPPSPTTYQSITAPKASTHDAVVSPSDGRRDVTSPPPVRSAKRNNSCTSSHYDASSNDNILKVRLDTRPVSPAHGNFPACESNAGKMRRRLRVKGKPIWANT